VEHFTNCSSEITHIVSATFLFKLTVALLNMQLHTLLMNMLYNNYRCNMNTDELKPIRKP